MRHKAKVVNVTPNYVEQEAFYNGHKLQFRDYRNGRVEFKFTDELAQSYGVKNIQELIKELGIQNEVAIGGIPEWVVIGSNGIYWECQMNIN